MLHTFDRKALDPGIRKVFADMVDEAFRAGLPAPVIRTDLSSAMILRDALWPMGCPSSGVPHLITEFDGIKVVTERYQECARTSEFREYFGILAEIWEPA